MPDRENVVAALGEINSYFRLSFDAMNGGTLACEAFRRYAEAAESAVALLKAQEPRVITDADFIGNPNMDSQGFLPAWIEYRRDGEWFEYWDDTDDEWSSVTADNYKGEGYRCWTSKPTPEQMEAVKWE